MEDKEASDILAALAHPGRLAVFRLLARRAPDGVRPSEIADALGIKRNTLSVYVSILERAKLVASRRKGKSVFYTIGFSRMGDVVDFLIADCCRGRPDLCAPKTAKALAMNATGLPSPPDRLYNVLFICTGNSARSIFAEAILGVAGEGRFRAYSAGTQPRADLGTYSVDTLVHAGHDANEFRPKSTDIFHTENAPEFDFVITVCDAAANEDCPSWSGQPFTAHWGIDDPAAVEGTDAEKATAYTQTYNRLHARILAFINLPIETLDRSSIQTDLDDIGQIDNTPYS